MHYSDVALQVKEEHPLAMRPQAGYHPESAFSLMDPDVLRDVLFFNEFSVNESSYNADLHTTSDHLKRATSP